MSSDAYRSYVVRVRRRFKDPAPDGHDSVAEFATRLDVEDLLGGSTATISGATADAFADSLERLVDLSLPHDRAIEP
ncbi:MAG: hypothetical protein ABIZ52_09085 [Candidatus Limnocylindrales bacterium]